VPAGVKKQFPFASSDDISCGVRPTIPGEFRQTIACSAPWPTQSASNQRSSETTGVGAMVGLAATEVRGAAPVEHDTRSGTTPHRTATLDKHLIFNLIFNGPVPACRLARQKPDQRP
jgi:hypothetical protein